MKLTARYVVPVDAPVIRNGAVLVESGLIRAVGRAADVSGGPTIDYGDAVICPGLINAHTHLELSFLAGQVPVSTSFTDWLHRLRTAARPDVGKADRVRQAVELGIAHLIDGGATAVGDITNHPAWSREILASSPLRAVSFGEVIAIGTIRDRLEDRLETAATTKHRPQSQPVPRAVRAPKAGAGDTARSSALAARSSGRPPWRPSDVRIPLDRPRRPRGDDATPHKGVSNCDQGVGPNDPSRRFRVGISPHAPYTVEPDGLRACARRADKIGAPLCIHLAETAEEEAFTRSRQGPLAEFLKTVGAWDDRIPISGCGPVELAAACGLLGSRTLLAHANYVTDDDIDRISRSGASVAYCPRTHAAFGHAPHRFRDMQAAGVNVCIGTDSLASNPSLSMLEELRFLKQHHPDVASDTLLVMATLRGAQALGLADATGSIAVGKSADLVVLRSDEPSTADRWDRLLESTTPPLEVYLAGVPQLSGRNTLRREMPSDANR